MSNYRQEWAIQSNIPQIIECAICIVSQAFPFWLCCYRWWLPSLKMVEYIVMFMVTCELSRHFFFRKSSQYTLMFCWIIHSSWFWTIWSFHDNLVTRPSEVEWSKSLAPNIFKHTNTKAPFRNLLLLWL